MSNPNQFRQSVVKGLADLRMNTNTIPCRVDADQSTALVAGQKVKIKDVAGGTPVVEAISSDEDKVFGIVSYNLKDAEFEANAAVEILSYGSVVYVEASAAIARGADVMPVISGEKVAVATAGKSVIGMAIDKAAADGDLIRIMVLEPEIKSEPLIQQGAIADLNQTISGSYVDTEVQAISDKVDALLASLRLAGVISV